MDAALIRGKLTSIRGRLSALGVSSLSVFGSAARGQTEPDSDLDFLVEFEGAATFGGYMELKEVLEGEFQFRIDLVTMRSLKPLLREQVLREAVRVA